MCPEVFFANLNILNPYFWLGKREWQSSVNNKNLFLNHYLENLIQKTPEWKLDEYEAAFDEIKKLYESVKPNVKNFREAQLIFYII